MSMSNRLCANWLDSYVDFCADFEPPELFQKWCGVMALSCAAGHRVWLEESNTKIWPNLYVIFVAESGVGKTTSMREVIPFIQATGIAISPDKITIPKLTQDLAACGKSDSSLGMYTPYLIWAEEFPSFLGMDAYQSGKIADLTGLYDCAEVWKSGTKTAGSDYIVQPYICMLAGSTPSGLFGVLPPESVGQGFTSRLIFIEAKNNKRRIAEKPWLDAFHGKLKESLLNDIRLISDIRGPMKLSDVARVYFNDYYINRPEPQEEYNDERMRGYAARKPFYAKKLALLLSLAERPQSSEHSMLIEAHHLERAFDLLRDVDRALIHVYSEIAKDSVIAHYAKVVKFLGEQASHEALRSSLSQRFAHSLTAQELTSCLESLKDMDVVESRAETVGQNSGRYRTIWKLVKGKEETFQPRKYKKSTVYLLNGGRGEK